MPAGTFDSALLAHGWNLFCQEGWPVLLECQRCGVAVHVAGFFHYVYDGGEDPARDRWEALCGRHSVALPAAAVAFATLPACIERVVMGSTRAEEVAPTLAVAAAAVPTALWREAQSLGLLDAALPLPA